MKNLSEKALIKEFHEFLRENNCASKFYANRTIKAPKERVHLFFKHTEPSLWIEGAFTWDWTPQKKTCWINLAKEWDKRLRAKELEVYLNNQNETNSH